MAVSRHHAAISRPLSVAEIVRMAEEFEYDPSRPLKAWLRSAQMLLTEGMMCEQEDDLQKAYLYVYRHAMLIMKHLPQHPEFKDPKHRPAIVNAQNTVNKNLAKLEGWKPKINRDYERYMQARDRLKAERRRVQIEQLEDERQRLADQQTRSGSVSSEEGAFEYGGQTLNANEHRQLAVDLAHREIRRRDATKQSTRQAGISPGTVASRRRGMVMDVGEESQRDSRDLGGVSESIREAERHLHHPGRQPMRRSTAEQPQTNSSSYQYPSVPAKEDMIDWRTRPLQPGPQVYQSYSRPPSLPAKQPLYDDYSYRSFQTPAPPPKQRNSLPPSPSTATPSPPPLSRPPPSKYTFKPTASTEAGLPLRTVLLPPDLRTTFLNLAHHNTLRNLETCGILCGTLISNALFISHLIIPDQTSTSDTCDTTEEGDNALFDYCDSHDLLVCGWIHTHPSQSCFLSSRDLHTSSGYQVMLPEAIAIVCAPRHNPDWGIFRLTDPPGLQHVLNCQQRSLFHPHSENNLYTDASRPGHVVEAQGLQFEVVDLRAG